jgi:predicted AlkP superfamily pyrophosphatase or phosphodiesterase
MKLKPITVIAVLLLVVATLLVAGCIQTKVTLSPANQANNVSTAYPTAGKSELLQGIAAYKNDNKGNSWTDYKVTWINNTALTIHYSFTVAASRHTNDYKYIHFPTIDAATAYFNSHRLEYTYKPESADSASLYALVTGDQNPSVVKEVSKYGDTTSHLEQFNSLIIESSWYAVSTNQA